VATCTYNVDGIKPDSLKKTDPITKMFEEMKTNDIIIINLQQVDVKFKNYFRSEFDGNFKLWNDYIEDIFPISRYYRRFSVCGTIMIIFIYNIKVSNYIKKDECYNVFLGKAGFGNKAAFASSLHIELLGSTMCIINCHLSAHDNNLQDRIENIKDVWNEVSFKNKTFSIKQHDIILWCGNMNFGVEKSFETAMSLIEQKKFTELAKFDQLNANKDVCFPGFKEHELNYPPTFKFLPNSDAYDPKRTPSWCDRILHKGDIQQESLKCFLDVKNSDHRPVVGIYECFLKDSQNVETSLNTVYKVTPQKIQFQKQRLLQVCYKTVVFSNDSPTSIYIDRIESTDKCIWSTHTNFILYTSDKTEIDIGCCLDIDDFKECKDSNIKTVNLLFKYNGETIKSIKVEIDYERPKFFGRSIDELKSCEKNMYPIDHLIRLAESANLNLGDKFKLADLVPLDGKEKSLEELFEGLEKLNSSKELSELVHLIEEEKIKSDCTKNPLIIWEVIWLWLEMYPGCIFLEKQPGDLESLPDGEKSKLPSKILVNLWTEWQNLSLILLRMLKDCPEHCHKSEFVQHRLDCLYRDKKMAVEDD